MEQQFNTNYENTKEFTINFKNIILALKNRKKLIIKIFFSVLLFFTILTFILPKEWTVKADLYINKANGTNYLEINPFAISELGGAVSVLGNSDPLVNELELIQSPLVIDKVVRENNLRYKKFLGIIPTKKSGEYYTVEKFLKKNVNIETKKGTNVLTIEYKSFDKDLSYNVVNSLINNYIDLYKKINSEKSKSDKELLESEYNKARKELEQKVNSSNGLPSSSVTGTGNLAAMSAFSSSAQKAISSLKGQLITGEKSRIDISENATKVSHLGSKLEWARLVEEMSNTSNVIIIKKPYKLREWEYSAPNLLINIILGIVMGIILSLIAVFYKEFSDKKLTYSMLGSDVIYNINNEYKKLNSILFISKQEAISIISFEKIPSEILIKLKEFNNISIIYVNLSEQISSNMFNNEKFVLFEKINTTLAEDYKLVKQMLKDTNKIVICEVLL